MEGKKLLELFSATGTHAAEDSGYGRQCNYLATDKEKYTLMITPKTSQWAAFNTKAGRHHRAGIGPVVMKTKKVSHAVIPADVFGIPIRASAYPIIEKRGGSGCHWHIFSV
jgi:hypothetical protein